ncbi:MAG: ceramidase domain-containing protein [Bacteriovoracaceae bacterium]
MDSLYPNPHPPGCFWHGAAEKFGAPNLKWCEETLCQVVSEPANTWSNIAFFIFAGIIFYFVKDKKSKSLKWIPWAFLLMAAGSFFYHTSNFYISQVLDFFGMYLLIHWLLALNLIRAKIFDHKKAVVFYASFIVANSVILHLMYLGQYRFQMLIAIAGALIFVSEFWARKKGSIPPNKKYFIGAILSVVVAQIFSLLDLTRVICDPTNHFFQGHALWHILSGLGLLLAYKHYEQFDGKLP